MKDNLGRWRAIERVDGGSPQAAHPSRPWPIGRKWNPLHERRPRAESSRECPRTRWCVGDSHERVRQQLVDTGVCRTLLSPKERVDRIAGIEVAFEGANTESPTLRFLENSRTRRSRPTVDGRATWELEGNRQHCRGTRTATVRASGGYTSTLMPRIGQRYARSQ